MILSLNGRTWDDFMKVVRMAVLYAIENVGTNEFAVPKVPQLSYDQFR